MLKGEWHFTVARQSLRIVESHGPRLAARFRSDPLLTSKEQARLRSFVKGDKDCTSPSARRVGGPRWGGGVSVPKGGKVTSGAKRKPQQGATKTTRWLVLGLSQVSALTVSPGLVSNVGSADHIQSNCPKP